MDEFQSNSRKSKENQQPEKKIAKVVTGKVKTKEKNTVQKVINVFVAEDLNSVVTNILLESIVPSMKRGLLDGLEMLLGIDMSRSQNKRPSNTRASYDQCWDNKKSKQTNTRATEIRSRYGYEYKEVIINSRIEASDVLRNMEELIDTYGMVSVGDLYDLVGFTGDYTDYNYGWTNVSMARVLRVDDGFLLKMPKVMPLK